jgi:hypothetical protein
MGIKARALQREDPVPRSDPSPDSSTTESFDDAFIKPLSELLAYAPPHRGRSSTLQARAVEDDQDDRMPLFLEHDRAMADDGFHFEQQEPVRAELNRQDSHTTNLQAHGFEPEAPDTSTDSFAKPGFLRSAAWAGGAAFTVIGALGAAAFLGGAFSGPRHETTGMGHMVQAATAQKQRAISFDQTFAALGASTQPEKKPETSELGVSTPAKEDDQVAAVTNDGKVQRDKSNEQAPAPPAAADLPRRIDRAELASLLKRGKELIEVGDIASARLLLQRAADAREPQAALALAGTYDAAVLGRVKAYGIAPDPAMARTWYEKAREFGSAEAQQRLGQ